MFCTEADVMKVMGGRQAGSAFTAADLKTAIEDATARIKGKFLAGPYSKDTVNSWGDTVEVPASVALICAQIAAAFTFERKLNQSLKGDSRAAGLYRAANDDLKELISAGTVAFDSDDETVAVASNPIRVSTSNSTPKCSMGDSNAGTTGTMDKW